MSHENGLRLSAAALLFAASAAADTKPATSGLDEVLRTAVAEGRVPAAVAVVATPDGVAYRGAFGASPDEIFAIASMTKPITSTAVMQLVEAGRIKLDEPAATYVPELASVQVLENGALRPPKSPVTVRQLLTHTSGFAYEFLNRELFDYVSKGNVPPIGAGGDGFLKAPLLSDPGTRWEYGINTDWLGKIVEKVSGQSLDAYLRQAVFARLGMNDTCFNVPPEKQPRLVSRFQRKEDGRLAETPRAPFKPVTFFSGGGGLFSTAEDYSKFARAILAGGHLGKLRILSPGSVAEMGRNQIGELPLRTPPSVIPSLVKEGAVLPGQLDKFGLGFALNTKPIEKGRAAGTLSWSGLYNTFFWVDREKGVCAVLLMQMLPALDDGPVGLVNDFDRAVYAWRAQAKASVPDRKD